MLCVTIIPPWKKKYLGCTMLMCVSAIKMRVPHTFHWYLILDKLVHQALTIKTTGLRVMESLKANLTYVFSPIVCQFHILTYRKESYFFFYHVLKCQVHWTFLKVYVYPSSYAQVTSIFTPMNCCDGFRFHLSALRTAFFQPIQETDI